MGSLAMLAFDFGQFLLLPIFFYCLTLRKLYWFSVIQPVTVGFQVDMVAALLLLSDVKVYLDESPLDFFAVHL